MSSPTPGTEPDTLAPAITGLSLSSNSFNPAQPGGAYFSAALQFSDNLSGFSYGFLSFRSTTSDQGFSLSLSFRPFKDPSSLGPSMPPGSSTPSPQRTRGN